MATKLICTGTIGKDAVLEYIGETPVINFPVARTENYIIGDRTHPKTLWLQCCIYSGDQKLVDSLKKGRIIVVSGHPGLGFFKSKKTNKQTATITLRVIYHRLVNMKPQNRPESQL